MNFLGAMMMKSSEEFDNGCNRCIATRGWWFSHYGALVGVAMDLFFNDCASSQ